MKSRRPVNSDVILLLMCKLKPLILTVVILLVAYQPAFSQRNLRYWVGKYPVNRRADHFTNIFRTPPLKSKLRRLLGPDYYRRVTFNDHFTMGPISLVADNYVIVAMCEAHNCVSKQMFLAANVYRGDVHVALYHYGWLDWYHTQGKSTDLPQPVLDELDQLLPTRRNVREIIRGAI